MKSTRGSGGCLCAAFVLALFATVSPYWVYRYSWNYTYGYYSGSSTVATGSFVVSSSSNAWQCGYVFGYCQVQSQWNHFSDFNNTLCKGDFYEMVGQYGFCSEEGGEFKTPAKVKQIQALSIATTVILSVAFVLALQAPIVGGKLAYAAAFFSIIAAATSCAAFSVATSYDYYKTFHSPGGYLPFVYTGTGCPTDTCIFLSDRLYMYWGPAFWSMVTVFIISFLASLSLFAGANALDEDDGHYGGGPAFNEPPFDPLDDQIKLA